MLRTRFTRHLRRPLLVALLAATPSLGAQVPTAQPTPAASIALLADSIAGKGSSFERTRRLVYWINDSFDWSECGESHSSGWM